MGLRTTAVDSISFSKESFYSCVCVREVKRDRKTDKEKGVEGRVSHECRQHRVPVEMELCATRLGFWELSQSLVHMVPWERLPAAEPSFQIPSRQHSKCKIPLVESITTFHPCVCQHVYLSVCLSVSECRPVHQTVAMWRHGDNISSQSSNSTLSGMRSLCCPSVPHKTTHLIGLSGFSYVHVPSHCRKTGILMPK